MLGKKQDYLENRIQRELALARMHGKQNKRGRLPAPGPSRSRDGRVARAPVPGPARCASRNGHGPRRAGAAASRACRAPGGQNVRGCPQISVVEMSSVYVQY